MARTKNPRFLQKKGRTWYAALDIPRDLRGHFDGKARFFQSLKTESESEAENKARPLISYWKDLISAAKRGESPQRVPHEQRAREWRADFRAAKGDQLETLKEVLPEAAERLKFNGEPERDAFIQYVRGETEILKDHLPAWVDSMGDQEPKTIDMKRSDVERFIERFQSAEQVTSKRLIAWVDELSQKDAPRTVRRKFSAVRTFWSFLQRKGMVESMGSPFQSVPLPKQEKTKKSVARKRQPFEPKQVVEIWRAAQKSGDIKLADLIWIGMWTGCRIEEICSLKLDSIGEDHFRIVDAKTESGRRDVPIHPRLRERLLELVDESRDGYLLSELTTNKYGDRSNAVGKRFGRLKSGLGYGEPHVFHSIRKTVSTSLENAGVAENISSDILGHDKQTMTYGLYSGGTNMKIRLEAISKIDYPV